MKGHIRRRGKASWAVILDIGRDTDGRRQQRWHSVRGTKKDAERELGHLLHSFNSGAYVEPTKLTVGGYLQRWLTDYAQSSVAGKTMERYRELIENHLTAEIGHIPLVKLQPLHIQSVYAAKLASGRKDGKGGLSPQSVKHMHRVLRTALGQAVKWRLLARNPVDAVEPPRTPRKEMKALDEQGTADLLTAFERSRLYIPVLVAVTTGLRRGELLGLRWSDIDLENGQISVCQSLEQTKGGLFFKMPKTKRSHRKLALPRLAIEAIRSHKATQAAERLLLGSAYQDAGLVFPRFDGQPWQPDSFSGAFAAQVRRSALPHIRLHDLRHSHASQLLRQGVSVKVVSERLGHASSGFTLDVYGHVLPGMQDDAARRIDAALRPIIQNK